MGTLGWVEGACSTYCDDRNGIINSRTSSENRRQNRTPRFTSLHQSFVV
jgi:hypothetical protein